MVVWARCKLCRWVQSLSTGRGCYELDLIWFNLKYSAFELVMWAAVEAVAVRAVPQHRKEMLRTEFNLFKFGVRWIGMGGVARSEICRSGCSRSAH